MGDAIVSYALKKLGDFVILKVVQRQKFRDDVEWMIVELGYMKALLKDAEKNQAMDHRVQEWVFEISDLAIEIVDIIDEFISKVVNRKSSMKGIVDRVKKYAFICENEANMYNISNEIESLRVRVLDLSRKKETYCIKPIFNPSGEGSSSSGPVNTTNMEKLRRTTSHADEEECVGFVNDTNILLNELHKHEYRRSVISIFGTGGLGKTTLARKLYNSSNFACRSWVCVSQEYSTEDLLRTVIESFKTGCNSEELERMKEKDLERHLLEFLNEKRYLVVVDDIWNKEAWESLKRAFPDNNTGSRVIITTRNKEVAERVNERSFVYPLRFLNQEESWYLFLKKIAKGHGDTHRFSNGMLQIGYEILQKCGGLPLAIVVLGGLLSHKENHEQWVDVKNQLLPHMKKESLDISHLLSLSYNDLSSELKQCFLYIGIYPEDKQIIIRLLLPLWMGEGFISNVNHMENIAVNYLQELIDRSLLIRMDDDCVKIHDLLRDLAVEKGRETRLFDIHDPRVYTVEHSRSRRISIHNQTEKFFSAGIYGGKLRSLVFFIPFDERPDIGILKIICQTFKLLCVLDLQDVQFTSSKFYCAMPDSVGGLIHLTHLNLQNTNINKLPSSIGKLINLRYLQLHQLKGRLNINTLTNLRALFHVHSTQWMYIDTTNLLNLRELFINNYSRIKGKSFSLDSVSNLKSLTTLTLDFSDWSIFNIPSLEPLVSCPNLLKLVVIGTIEKLPPFNKFSQSLECLTLKDSRLSEDPMPTLEKLLNLRDLDLRGHAYTGKEITCSDNGFLQLEHLKLYIQSLKKWNLANTAMPVIRSLNTDLQSQQIPERLKPFLEDESD